MTTDNVIDLSAQFEERRQRNRPQTTMDVFARLMSDPEIAKRILDAPLKGNDDQDFSPQP